MERFEEGFGKWVVKQRSWLIIGTILVVVAAAIGVRFLTINRDNRVFFSEENPQLQALEELENTYTKRNNVFLAIAPKNGNVFTRETLAAASTKTTTFSSHLHDTFEGA